MIVCPVFDKFARTILFLPSMSARSICGLLPTEEKYMYLEKVRHVNVSALNTILLNLISALRSYKQRWFAVYIGKPVGYGLGKW